MKSDNEIDARPATEEKLLHKFRRVFKPVVDAKVEACAEAVKFCPHGAITLADNKLKIDYNLCDGCLICVRECHTGAIKEVRE